MLHAASLLTKRPPSNSPKNRLRLTQIGDLATTMATFVRRGVSTVRSTPFSPSFSARAFASSSRQLNPAKAPALADVLPDGGPTFDAKQREFRDKLISAQKQKEQQESTYITSILINTSRFPSATQVTFLAAIKVCDLSKTDIAYLQQGRQLALATNKRAKRGRVRYHR